MDSLVLIARVGLIGLFLVSGAAKLVDRPGTRFAVAALGVPAFAEAVAWVLPFVEMAVAGMLIPRPTVLVAGFAAAVLMLIFSGVVTTALVRGRSPECSCFGNLRTSRIGPATLGRNGMFLAAALLVVLGRPSSSAVGLLNAIAGVPVVVRAVVAVIAACTGLALTLVGIRRSSPRGTGGVAVRVASPAPDFTLSDLHGRTVSLGELIGRGREVLLVFVSMHCSACTAMAPEIARWQRDLSGRLTVAVVAAGTAESVRNIAEPYGFAEVLIDGQRAVAKAFSMEATPAAVLIGVEGAISSTTAVGGKAISDLILQAFGLDEIVAELADRDGDPRGSMRSDIVHSSESTDQDGPPQADLPEIVASYVPRGRSDVGVAQRDGNHVLVDRSAGTVHVLNETAAVIWACLDGSGTIGEIANDLAEVFARDPREVLDSIVDTVKGFARAGLLEIRTNDPSVSV